MALSYLRQGAVADVNESSKKARALNTHWESAIRKTLNDAFYDFAIDFAELALVSDSTNLSGYSYLYALPADCIQLVRVFDDESVDLESVPYRITKNGIYTSSSPVYAEYVSFVDDTSKWDETAKVALARNLAAMSAAEILGSDNATDFLDQQYAKSQAEAASKTIGKSNTTYKVQSTWLEGIKSSG